MLIILSGREIWHISYATVNLRFYVETKRKKTYQLRVTVSLGRE